MVGHSFRTVAGRADLSGDYAARLCGRAMQSAIKRDRGVKDFGAMIEGHGGMMDRIDSLCFAAPVFSILSVFISPEPSPDQSE